MRIRKTDLSVYLVYPDEITRQEDGRTGVFSILNEKV